MYSDDQSLVSVVCIGVRCALATGHAAIIHGARRNGGVVFFAPMALRRWIHVTMGLYFLSPCSRLAVSLA